MDRVRQEKAGSLERRTVSVFPRIPLSGALDLTWRCNNRCRHCWVRLPPDSTSSRDELSFEEVRRIVDEARSMGCRHWSLSGGEPMLREDFTDIFKYVMSKCSSYSLNTNGTRITPEIARAMRRRGVKMVALYGASARVHDRVTRRPGSFEEAIQGIAFLREAGAGFTVQLVPMRENLGEWEQMIDLARSLSPRYRVGAAWLHLSGHRDEEANREILRQRLDPAAAVLLDPPPWGDLPDPDAQAQPACGPDPAAAPADDRLFAACIGRRREFHVDPYGGMSFCSFLRDPSLRFDLRRGSVEECWDRFIPSLADRVRGGREYREGCGTCERRKDCRWCAAHGWLEHGRFPARVEYLCKLARESGKVREDRERSHSRSFGIGGITLRVVFDLPIREDTFLPKFDGFRVAGPGSDPVRIRHSFGLPDLEGKDLGEEVYRRPPWAIHRARGGWVYLGISPDPGDASLHKVAVFSDDYTRGRIYHPDAETFHKGGLASLTLLPTDQILLAPLLADRQGMILHAAGVILEGQGLLFVGPSGAGKSTVASLLRADAEVLCDDRMIVRRKDGAFRVFGTWSHGDLPDVSPSSAPLRAVLFLEKAGENRLVPLDPGPEIVRRLLSVVIRGHETRAWWEKTLGLAERLGREVPFFSLEFDRRDGLAAILREALGPVPGDRPSGSAEGIPA